MRKLRLILIGLMIPILGCNNIKNDFGELKKQLYISAWYATYDTTRGLKSFTDHLDLFHEINPVWYNLNPAYLTPGEPPFQKDLRNQATIASLSKSAGIKLLPTIQNLGATNFDGTLIGKIISDPQLRTRHVEEITSLVKAENYDGIDIDYENMVFGVRQAYSLFISELGQALHQDGKLLSVTVYAKTTDAANWAGPGAQDWAALARSADSLKIMAYDYHWLSFHAGPISPVDWLEKILQYAATIPEARGKVMIGLPLYGLDWGGTAAKEKTYQDAINLMVQNNISAPDRNDVDHSADLICGAYSKNVELHYQYQNSGLTRTVYFQDGEALRRRLEIINQYRDQIKGVTFWRLGGEDPRSWDELRKIQSIVK